MQIVTIGGGGGQNRVLTALCLLQARNPHLSITAIPITTDSGGSSGILRRGYDVIAVGDIGQCIAGLHPDPESIMWLLGHRFAGNGPLYGHTARNCIVLSALQYFGSNQRAMDSIGQTFGLLGTVAPVTFEQADVCARLCNGDEMCTEESIYQGDLVSAGGLECMWLDPLPAANPAALLAIANADVVIICPGTLACSVIPNFLVDGVREALALCRAQKICITNLVNARRHVPPEWTVYDHAACLEHYMGTTFDVLVCNTEEPSVKQVQFYSQEGEITPPPVAGYHEGVRILAMPLLEKLAPNYSVADASAHLRASVRHDPYKLADALAAALHLKGTYLLASN